jgi:hypothetical protein
MLVSTMAQGGFLTIPPSVLQFICVPRYASGPHIVSCIAVVIQGRRLRRGPLLVVAVACYRLIQNAASSAVDKWGCSHATLRPSIVFKD